MLAEVRDSLASLTFEWTRMQNINYYYGGTHSRPQLIDSAFPRSQTMRDEASPVEDIESFTQRMLALIAERTAQLTSVRKDGDTSSTIKANSPTVVPAQAVKRHSARSSKGNAEEATSASKHSTEYLQMMGKVAATCKKDGDERPVVMRTVLAVTLEEPTKKQHRSTLSSSSTQEESKSLRLNTNKTVDDLDQLAGISGGPKHIPEEDQLKRSTESKGGVGFDKVHGLARSTQTKSVSVKKTFEPPSQNDYSENRKNESAQCNSSLPDITHSKRTSSVNKMQMNDDQCVPSSGSKAMGEEESVKEIVLNAEYEDISEYVQPAYEGLNCDSWYKELQLEDISGESENEVMRNPSFLSSAQDTQSEGEQILCEAPHMKKGSTPDEELNEKSVSLKTVAVDQPHHTLRPFCKEPENEESDEQWLVIPITISDLRYEPASEEEEDVENVQLDEDVTETWCNKDQVLGSDLTKKPSCALSEIKMFDTVDGFEKATGICIIDTSEVAPSRSTPDCEGCDDGKPVPHKISEQNPESDDSCDTEDSCDYPSESKRNHLTVSDHFLVKTPAPLTPAPFVSVETHGQHKNVPTHQTTGLSKITEKLRQMLKTKAVTKQITNKESENSDSDDEIHQKREKKAKKKMRFTTRSKGNEDSSCNQHENYSPERVDSHENRLPSIDLQAPQSHSTFSNTQSMEVTQDAQLSNRTGTSGWHIETKAKPESFQHEPEKCKTANETKLTECDSESEKDQSCKQGAKKLNCSEDRGKPLCIDQVAPQQRSPLHGEELKETIQDTCSDQRTETNSGSECDRHKTLNDIIVLDSDTEDESDDNLIINAKKKRLFSSDCKGGSTMRKISTTEDVIILLSDSDEDCDVNNKEHNKTTFVTSVLASCHDTCAAKEEHKKNPLPSANSLLPQHFSKLDETHSNEPKQDQPSANSLLTLHFSNLDDPHSNEPKQDTCSGSINEGNTSHIKAKDRFENVQHKTKNLKVSEETKVTDADQELGKKRVCKKVSFKRRILSSSEDSSDEHFFSSEERPSPEPQDRHHETATRKPETVRSFSDDLSNRPQQSMDRATDSVLGSSPVISSLFVSSPDQIHGRLKLWNCPPGSSNVCGLTLKKSSGVVKSPVVSRQHSFPPHVSPSTSSRHMSSSSGPRRKARRPSVPSKDLPSSDVSREALGPSRSRQNVCASRPPLTSAKAQPSNPSAPDQIRSPTEGPSYSTTQLTKTKVLESWKSTFPNKGEVRRRRRRSWLDDNLGTTCHDSSREVGPRPSHDVKREVRPGPSGGGTREVRPGPSHSDLSERTRPVPSHSKPLRVPRSEPRRRKRRTPQIRSLDAAAPLMKKTKIHYSQLPKATNRDSAQGQSYPVGENYKWGQPKKGPSRERKPC